ncbi:hypothetical protein D3C74_419920 [compost metagenome]
MPVQTAAIGTSNATLSFLPAHLPKGAEWRVKCIVSGAATPTINGALINIDITEGETTSSTVLRAIAETTLLSAPWPFNEIFMRSRK